MIALPKKTKSKVTYSSYTNAYNNDISFKELSLRKNLPYIINESLLVEMLEYFSPSGEEEIFINWIVNYVETLQKNDPSSIYLIEEQIEKECNTYQSSKYQIRNIYITKYPSSYTDLERDTNLYPCIVAHTDEVHYNIEDRKIFKEVITPLSKIDDKDMTAFYGSLVAYSKDDYGDYERCGLSADDKVGIYAGLHALKVLPKVKLAFFASEEVGCIGSSLVDLDFFDNVSFAIQLDRRGNNDLCTTTNGVVVASQEFEDLLMDVCEPYGYDTAVGTCTDVGELKIKGIKCSAVNMSCGYRNEHQSSEIIDLQDMNVAVSLMLEVCKKGLIDVREKDQKIYTHISTYNQKNLNHYYDRDWDTYDDYKDNHWRSGLVKSKTTTKDLKWNSKTRQYEETEYSNTSKLSNSEYDWEGQTDLLKTSKVETLEKQSFREFCEDTPILYPNNVNLKQLENSIKEMSDAYLLICISIHLEKRDNCLKSEELILSKIDKILAKETSKRYIKEYDF